VNYTGESSPNKPRPVDPLVIAVADALARIEANYDREGSGPGSRFEGLLLEDVQAKTAVAVVRSQPDPKYQAWLDELTRSVLNLSDRPALAALARRIRLESGLGAVS
jgi:hypothetical protein